MPITTSSSSDLPLITINTSSQLPVKLTTSNYPSWHAIFTTILVGYDLMGYLDGTLPCPSTPTEKSSAGDLAHYAHGYRQDQLLLNAIFSSVSETVMPLITMTTTSPRLFASKSRARIIQLKEDLTLIQQGFGTVSEFLHAVKVTADELSLIDAPVSDDD
ncbi:hypothetical protein MIMGU_mgv11b021353mg [Erythranthe guttata]|uniref:Retrotransposon Copia-like N-terminal domain-containing protein n=1 Tax=Erythranthe guttata TaxID=4155 RepID=A0A022PX58_ERYGU|nr:hypothetical protein MIMGU_mgv11b021353mg [Erythranthe guttata]